MQRKKVRRAFRPARGGKVDGHLPPRGDRFWRKKPAAGKNNLCVMVGPRQTKFLPRAVRDRTEAGERKKGNHHRGTDGSRGKGDYGQGEGGGGVMVKARALFSGVKRNG